jgi:branched-chain amino acid transport system permease protein
MYALIAIGYTLVYGVLRLINFAHGDIMMVGAFMAFIFFKIMGLNFYVAVTLSIIVTAIVGILTYVSVYKPLLDKNAPKISLLITAIGISFFLESLFNVIANQYLGGTYQAFYFPKWFSAILHIKSLTIPVLTLIIPIMTLILLLIVLYILYKTKIGIAIRALAFDINTVKLMGADSNKIIAFVFALGSALAAIGGISYAMAYPSIDPYMGMLVGLKAFAAAVVGGIGSVTGAVIGGFILGFAEVAIPGFFPELGGWKDAFAFIFLIFVLLFKPTGIMGIDFERQRF